MGFPTTTMSLPQRPVISRAGTLAAAGDDAAGLYYPDPEGEDLVFP